MANHICILRTLDQCNLHLRLSRRMDNIQDHMKNLMSFKNQNNLNYNVRHFYDFSKIYKLDLINNRFSNRHLDMCTINFWNESLANIPILDDYRKFHLLVQRLFNNLHHTMINLPKFLHVSNCYIIFLMYINVYKYISHYIQHHLFLLLYINPNILL